MKSKTKTTALLLTILAVGLALYAPSPQPARANPQESGLVTDLKEGVTPTNLVSELGGTDVAISSVTSTNVAIIGSPGSLNGGTLPTSGSDLAGITFTNLAPANVNAANLAPFDTVILNVASAQMNCTTATLSAAAKADLVAFVGGAKKLIIYDSECAPGDYSWLPFPFTTSNPGNAGARGNMTIVENDTLGSNVPGPYFINAPAISTGTDAVGDANVFVSFDPNWCLQSSATNTLGVTGPVHTYAKYPAGTDAGLFIYNGLDIDVLPSTPGATGPGQLRQLYVLELQQPVNPSNLPCGFTVVGITLVPPTATNPVGTTHTVTATIRDNLGIPQPGILVTFSILSGPNTGATGTCSPSNCTTGANGQVSFTYADAGGAGSDTIRACFTGAQGQVCSQPVTKTWMTTTGCPPGRCCVCHKGTTLSLTCNSLEHRRHLDHQDPVGTCP